MIGGCGVNPLLRRTFLLCLITTRSTSLFQNCHLHHSEKLLYRGKCINGTSQGLTFSLFLRISGPAPIIELNYQVPSSSDILSDTPVKSTGSRVQCQKQNISTKRSNNLRLTQGRLWRGGRVGHGPPNFSSSLPE